MALEMSSNGRTEILFKGGRVDCLTSPDDPNEKKEFFCAPFIDRKKLMAWFMGPNGFGMNENQVTYHMYYPITKMFTLLIALI